MRVVGANSGKPTVKLDRSEVRRAMELSYLVGAVQRTDAGLDETDHVSLEHLIAAVQRFARMYGAEHFDANWNLKEPARRKAVDESAPAA